MYSFQIVFDLIGNDVSDIHIIWPFEWQIESFSLLSTSRLLREKRKRE